MKTTYHDMQKLSETELLSLTFRESSDIGVVKNLLSRINAMEELLSITVQELDEIEGMEEGAAEQFTAAMELSRRIYSAPPRKTRLMSSPDAVAEHLIPSMHYLDRELFMCIYLNRKNGFLFKETISIGSLTASIVHPREVFKPAIKRSAASVILVHNHPSGDPTPSQEDIHVTHKLIKAGNILGILVLDHIVVGDGQYVSFKETGLMGAKEGQ